MASQGVPTQTGAMPSIRPKKKLKALHWDKVDTPQVTVWASHAPTDEEREEKYSDLAKRGVLDEVERLFMAKETKIFGRSNAAKQRKDKKQIISNELSKNFQISMAKYSQYPAEDIVQMVIHCDKEVLDNMVVMEFLQRDEMCTIPENISKLMAPYSKDWTGPDASRSDREQDPSELTREDQIYLYTAFELNHYWKARMRALALTRSYEPDYEHISSRLRDVVQVSESLRDSVALMNVLGLILDIGNFMNDANKQAQGFKLGSLARLGMVKDDKNESTFADLVERIVRNQYPEWENFVDEINGVIGLQKLNIDHLRTDAKKYIDNIKNVQASLDAGNLSDPKKFHPQDRVSQVVQRSMKDARRKAEQMGLYLEDMTKTYNDIMVFYGEDSGDDNARRDFFAKLGSFLMEWKVCLLFLFPFVCVCVFFFFYLVGEGADITVEIPREEHDAGRKPEAHRGIAGAQAHDDLQCFQRYQCHRRDAQCCRYQRCDGLATGEATSRRAAGKRPARSPPPRPLKGTTQRARYIGPARARRRGG